MIETLGLIMQVFFAGGISVVLLMVTELFNKKNDK